MQGYFWNTVLAINSCLWFPALAYLTYATGMLFLAGEWKQFLFALSTFIVVTLIELVLTGLAHGTYALTRMGAPKRPAKVSGPQRLR